MPIVAPGAPVVTPPPVSFNYLVVSEFNAGLNLAGKKSANFQVCLAALNSDGLSFTEPTPPIRFQGVVQDALAEIEQLASLATNATANAAAAAANAETLLTSQINNEAAQTYIAANPVAPIADPNPTQDEIDAYNAAIAAQQTAATAAGAAAVTAAAAQIAAAGTAASNASLGQAQAAGALAQAMVAFDTALQNVTAAYLNYLKPAGFPTLAVQ